MNAGLDFNQSHGAATTTEWGFESKQTSGGVAPTRLPEWRVHEQPYIQVERR